MSSRWYPRYVKGNPQLRIFLPDFWMKLVKPEKFDLPPDRVVFKVHPRMTEHDCKNYLEKIYKVPVAAVRSFIKSDYGVAKGASYVIPTETYRLVWVSLPMGQQFEFPDLFPKEKMDKSAEEEKQLVKDLNKLSKRHMDKNWDRHDAPTWFS